MGKKFEIKDNGLRHGLLFDSGHGDVVRELEKKFLATGEEQLFLDTVEESEGFGEPKDYFEISCILKVREEEVGWWTGRKKQIF
ncbi:MAG TPA: hypothetical protein P5262_00065 [Candidatus Moranbacteria bacterium]|nr:hypothetical protein [Candidatus Moranbacteria bacterium]